MDQKDNSPFNFDDLGAFDQLDSAFDQEQVEEQAKADDTFSLGDDSGFNFDPPELNNSAEPELNNSVKLSEDAAYPTEPVRLMKCVCSKCAEKTEVDLALMPENGFVTSCHSCNTQIHVTRESSACRARRKSHEISCANCGKLLDQQPHCHSCGTGFPDYFVTFDPSDVRRKARRDFFSKTWAAVRDLNFSFKPAFKSSSHEIANAYTPHSKAVKTTAKSSGLLSQKFAKPIIGIIVALVFIAAGLFAYNAHKSAQIYTENYFKALYCIKSGVDNNINTCTLLKTEWDTASAAGRSFYPGISSKDETKAGKLRGEVEKYMSNMNETPKKFSQAKQSLTNVYNVYLETEALFQSKPKSPQELAASVENLTKKMTLVSNELKSNIPESFKQELEKSKLKYRGMKNF